MNYKIAVTGAGCTGKSQIIKRLKHEYKDEVLIIPEVTEMFYKAGLPFPSNRKKVNEFKDDYIKCIINVQKEIEDLMQKAFYNDNIKIICDRGILDNAAYYHEPDKWFEDYNTTLEEELKRYDMIIQLGINEYIYVRNRRKYSIEEAKTHEKLLKHYYEQHENYHFISEQNNFEDKYKIFLELMGFEYEN